MKNRWADHNESCRSVSDECRQVRTSLPAEMLNELDERTSSGLFHHICQCRSCFEVYVSLQAAAELACPLPDHDLPGEVAC